MPRQPLSKKLRFDVFKRDGFTCQYCGSTPPAVTLEVDHIVPVSKKGTNEIDNLLTSCFDCNRGKSNRELTSLPTSTLAKQELLLEKELQYKEYQKLLLKIEKRLRGEISQVESVFNKYFGDPLSESFKNGSIKTFLKKLSVVIVSDAMENACCRMDDAYDARKYFCGICWNIIKNKKPSWQGE